MTRREDRDPPRVGSDALPGHERAFLASIQSAWVTGNRSLSYRPRIAAGPLSFLRLLWALPAGTGDVLTALFAVPAAIALATGTAEGRKAAILWNIFGLADFAVAITLGMIISPGPFQLIVLNGPSIGLDGYPNVLTPAFAVPGSILLHALSLRQLFRRSRAETV
jgi:hypothetical protein